MEIVFSPKKVIHNLFEVTVFMKGFNGVLEIIIGTLFFFFKRETIYNAIITLTNQRVIQHSTHLTNSLTNQANHFSGSTQYFIAVYFLFYGIINIFLVICLLRGKLWAYPLAMMCFALFIVYQIYRLYLHHSGLLLFFTFFDVVLLLLTALEYKRVQSPILT